MAQGDSKKTKSGSTRAKQSAKTDDQTPAELDEAVADVAADAAETVADAKETVEATDGVDEPAVEDVVEDIEEVSEHATDAVEEPPHDDLAHLDADHVMPHEEEHRSGSFSSKVLIALLLLLIGAGGALYAAPRIAPMLPEWASGLRPYLLPGGDKARKEVAALRAEVEEKLAAQSAAVEAVKSEGAGDLQARIAEVEAAVSTPGPDIGAIQAETDDLAKQIAALNTDMAQRIDAAEATIEGLRAEIGSLSTAAASTSSTGGEVNEAALARIQEIEAGVEGLRAEMLSLADSNTRTVNDGLSVVRADLDEARVYVDEKIASLAADAEARVEAAQQEVAAVQLSADVETAMADLNRQFQDGAPFADALEKLAAATGATPPAALTDTAEGGVATLGGLRDSLVAAGHQAVSASMKAATGGSLLGGIAATLESQFTGIPSEATDGPEPPAVLSRARARLNENDLDGALKEIDALPSEAQSAMQDWIDAATARRDAEAAMSEFIKKAMPTQG